VTPATQLERSPEATTLAHDLDALEAIVAAWDAPYAATTLAYRGAIDALNAEAFRRLIAVLRTDRQAMAALKTAVTDELVYAVLRHHELIRPSLQERVEAALDGVRPMLASHGGDVTLVRVVPPAAIEVRFTGACETCPASITTFTLGVKRALETECPEITDVRQVKGLSSAPTAGGVRYIVPSHRSIPRAGSARERSRAFRTTACGTRPSTASRSFSPAARAPSRACRTHARISVSPSTAP